MTVVADFSVPADSFCLGETLTAVPAATVELARLVAHSPEYVMPFVWVKNAQRDVIDGALVNDPTVESAEVTEELNDSLLYQIAWADVVGERLHSILDHDGVVLEARGSTDEWRLWVRFGSRDHFSGFHDHFSSFGELTLHQMTPRHTPEGITYGTSADQRQALLAAFDAGYFDTPSAASGEELAEELGVSQQAVSGLLRRGTKTLIENTLARHRVP